MLYASWKVKGVREQEVWIKENSIHAIPDAWRDWQKSIHAIPDAWRDRQYPDGERIDWTYLTTDLCLFQKTWAWSNPSYAMLSPLVQSLYFRTSDDIF